MKITICIGSACHIKGSRIVAETLQKLIKEDGLTEKIQLGGTFCMGKCQEGVNVAIDGKEFSVTPETTVDFYENIVKKSL